MRFCTECGKENTNPNDRFCGYCGAKIDDYAVNAVTEIRVEETTETTTVPLSIEPHGKNGAAPANYKPSVMEAPPRKKRGGLIAVLSVIVVVLAGVAGVSVYALINGTESIPILNAILPSNEPASAVVSPSPKPREERAAKNDSATEPPSKDNETPLPTESPVPTSTASEATPSPAPTEAVVAIEPTAPAYAEPIGEPPLSAEKQAYLDTLITAEELETAVDAVAGAANKMPLLKLANAAWEEEINRIYGIVRDNLPADEFEVLKYNERAWIKYRDGLVDAVGASYKDETEREYARTLEYMRLTKVRMYELIDYRFDGITPTAYVTP